MFLKKKNLGQKGYKDISGYEFSVWILHAPVCVCNIFLSHEIWKKYIPDKIEGNVKKKKEKIENKESLKKNASIL